MEQRGQSSPWPGPGVENQLHFWWHFPRSYPIPLILWIWSSVELVCEERREFLCSTEKKGWLLFYVAELWCWTWATRGCLIVGTTRYDDHIDGMLLGQRQATQLEAHVYWEWLLLSKTAVDIRLPVVDGTFQTLDRIPSPHHPCTKSHLPMRSMQDVLAAPGCFLMAANS